jgi:multidrug efflux pump subunit AcrB
VIRGGVTAWFAQNSVAANLIMVSVMAAGLIALPGIRTEIFPELAANVIAVGVEYPGASPQEVEEAICARIEDQVEGIEGIERVTSTATENAGAVSIEVMPEADLRRVLDDVKSRVDAIDTFPAEAERPVVQEIVLRRQVINVAVSGRADERSIKRIAERVRDDLAALDDISQVELAGVRPYEISIEVSEAALRRHELTFDQVAGAVRRSSLDLPGGAIETRDRDVLVRGKGQAYRAADFESLPLITRPDGSRLTIGDVARVTDGFADADRWARFDGDPAALVRVFRVGEQSAPGIAQRVADYVARAGAWLPPGIRLTTWADESRILRERIELLVRNALTGFVLVFLLLGLFLRVRLAFWVALGIPTAFLGTVAVMPLVDVSINMISLFAFLVVLGIVVDDAIVVGENVFRHRQTTPDAMRASIFGAREVAVSVTFGVLTTVAAFLPMFNVGGNARAIWRVIPLVVIPTLLFSLLESKLVLPAHLAHMRGERERAPLWERPLRFVQDRFTAGLQLFLQHVQRPLLEAALRWRYLTLALFGAILALAIGLAGSGRIGFKFFPQVEADNVVASLTMPQGTPAAVTAAHLARIEAAALALREEYGSRVIQHQLATIGDQPFRADQSRNAGQAGQSFAAAYRGEVNLALAGSDQRDVTAEEILRRWRDAVGPIPEATELSFSAALFAAGDDLVVELAAADLDLLRRAAAELKARLATYAGVSDITDTLRPGTPELELSIRPEAEALGLSMEQLARQVRQAFHGEEAQRIQRQRDDVKVMVRYPDELRSSLGDLEQMRIRTADGAEVPFGTVADVRPTPGTMTIRRADRRRTTEVKADVDETKTNANEIVGDLSRTFLPQLAAKHGGLGWSFQGEQRTQAQTLEGLRGGFLLALFLIYALMAVPLKSYVQPLLIMTAIPFGFVGAMLGHLLIGIELSVMSMFGLVALAGVAVNDSLVLVDYVNQARRRGTPLFAAVRDAGMLRFRPILLTSLTTFAGLTPLILERSVQAKFLIPMAVSLGFGVMFATFVTLFLVPALYVIVEDLRRLLRWIYARPAAPAA